MALVSRQNEGGDEGGGPKVPTLLGPDAAGPSPLGNEKNAINKGNQFTASDAADEVDNAAETDERALKKSDRARPGIPPTVDYRRIQSERPTKPKAPFFTIYKSGQGYWTRIGTVAGAAVMFVYSLYFLYQSLGSWLAWSGQTGGISAGPGNPFLVGAVGAAIVLMLAYTFGAGTGLALILGLGGGVAADILCSRGYMGKAPTADKSVILAFVAIYALSFIILSFRLMNRPSNVDFLIATDSEMKKVNWTTRAELIGSTKVVILFVILIALFLFVVDMFFWKFFQLIHVLKGGPFG